MKRIAALVCAGLMLTACADGSSTAGTAPGSTTSPTLRDRSREVQVYAAVIRELVLGANGAGPAAGPYERIWVVDHEVINAEQPESADRPGKTFSDDLKAGLTQALADLPPLAFVPSRASVMDAADDRAYSSKDHIRGHGTVISLGPIEAHGDRVQVGHEAWCNAHCAEWFTSVLQVRNGAWVVTGETGPHAIT